MRKRSKWILIAAGLVAISSSSAFFYVYGLPSAIKSLLSRRVSSLSTVDYAVYAAFLDEFFSADEPFWGGNYISGNTLNIAVETRPTGSPPSILPLEVVALGPDEMAEDLFRQNSQTWQLRPYFHTKFKVLLVSKGMLRSARMFRPKPNEKTPTDMPDSGVLELSRVGFDRKGTCALLYFNFRCGWLCGRSGWVVLNKQAGNWRIKQFGPGAIY